MFSWFTHKFLLGFVQCGTAERSDSVGRALDWGLRVTSASLATGEVSVLCP